MGRLPKSTPDEIADRCLAARTRLLSRVISAVYDEALRPVGITSSQMVILTALAKSGGVQPAELCDILMVDKSTLSRNVDRMERNGWVAREACDDARSHRLMLTGKGREMLDTAVPQWRVAQEEAETLVGKGGMEAVTRVTRRLRGF
jgi:DNA-binding MarR family transcriptional regulator